VQSPPRIGVVGLGMIGGDIVTSLDRSGITAIGLDVDQQQEAVLHLSVYAGASNGTMAYRGALEAIERHRDS
jgi:UDP-N-acetyl-D-mannosaminuronate dehydrogenase